MATFSLTIKCYWSKENGFEKFIEDDIENDDEVTEEQEESADDQEMASDDE